MLNKKNTGFTLVELAIVLVIIGLVVGGVLVGSELIRAAGVQKFVRAIEANRAASATFLVKYNALPGDISRNSATSFGLSTVNVSYDAVGNNDSMLNNLYTASLETSCSGALSRAVTCLTNPIGESQLYFVHLSEARLFNQTLAWSDAPNEFNAIIYSGQNYPRIDYGTQKSNAYTVVSGIDGRPYYIYGLRNGNTTHVFSSALRGAFTGEEAFSVDSKIDDGVPTTGVVFLVRFDGCIGILRQGVVGCVTADWTGSINSGEAYDINYTSSDLSLAVRN